MKLTKEQLENFAAEINADWIGGYKALVVYHNSLHETRPDSFALIISLNNETEFHCKLQDNGDIECDDAMTIIELNYMLTR